MLQVIKQTREEKVKMYMKTPKKELAEMLVNCNEALDKQISVRQIYNNQKQKPENWHYLCGQYEGQKRGYKMAMDDIRKGAIKNNY